MPLPLLPRNIEDPTGQDSRERRAMADFKKRLEAIKRKALALLNDNKPEIIIINAEKFTQRTYTFNLTDMEIDDIVAELQAFIDEQLMEGGKQNLWFMNQYVKPAYQQGTGMAQVNLATQSGQYALARPDLTSILISPEYARRVGNVRAREFEEMSGFTAQVKADLSRILSRGMMEGLNPLDISKQITDQTGIEVGRANRIARTEITTALRRARLDEAESAQVSLGILTMVMHLSALSATTRASHAARHAQLYTIEQERIWMATAPNMINCKCSMVEVLVNEQGQPLTPKIISKAQAMIPAYAERVKAKEEGA